VRRRASGRRIAICQLRSRKRLGKRIGSFAKTRGALGLLDGNEIAWFWIGTHSAYDRLLDNL